MKRSMILAVLAWLAVVSLGAAGAWIAIDHAGEAVTGTSRVPVLADGQSTTPPSSPSPTPGQPPTSTSRPSGGGVTRTWDGDAGRVIATCRAGRAALVGAEPADGWHIERIESDEVEVRFERGESELEVKVRCKGGTPSFDVESKSGEDDD